MKIKFIFMVILIIAYIQNGVNAASMDKIQRGADAYFTITQRLDMSLNQQRKAFGIKLEEMVHLTPLLKEIKANEEKLEELLAQDKKDNNEEIEKLYELIKLQQATASQKKRYYASRYKGLLNEEQLGKLDELIYDIANGYLKL